MENTERKVSDSLAFTASKVIKEGRIDVKITLDDHCKNGHQDFAITGDIYSSPTSKADRYHISGGCIHEDILKHFPEFEPFVKLHLCDYNGAPMYAIENGFYHLKKGFDQMDEGETQKDKFCSYYRMDPKQYDIIIDSENSLEYAIHLKELGIVDQWKKEAEIATKMLEDLTGLQFKNNSKKSQYIQPETAKVEEFHRLKKEGYYKPEKKAERSEEKKQKAKADLLLKFAEESAKVTAKATTECKVKSWIVNHLDKISTKPLHIAKGYTLDFSFDNYIYYDHSNTIKFNWMDHRKMMTTVEFNIICEQMHGGDFEELPEGISFQFEDRIMYGRD